MKRILIEIQSGLVQAVYTDGPTEIFVVDLDKPGNISPAYREFPQPMERMSTSTSHDLRDLIEIEQEAARRE